ncbi:MAG: HEAT repeat domain-containing protein [Armatimonadota bacterium]|nr:HEAT repeat domain-containing protein [bacterium]
MNDARREPEEPGADLSRMSVEHIIAGLCSKNAEERAQAAEYAIVIEDELLLDSLVMALSDPEETVRALAVYAISNYKKSEIIVSLTALLQDTSGWVCESAVHALAIINWVEAKPFIMGALNDSRLRVRAEAINCLARFGDSNDITMLARIACQAQDTIERKIVIHALAERDDRAVDDYMHTLVERADLTAIAAAFSYFLRHLNVIPTHLLTQALSAEEPSPMAYEMAKGFARSAVDELVSAASEYMNEHPVDVANIPPHVEELAMHMRSRMKS